MYNSGDNLYIIDNGRWQHKKEIVILKRKFVKYTDMSHEHLTFDGDTSLTIQAWATQPTIDSATKFAVTYLIMAHELALDVTHINVEKEYHSIEENYPDLIFKYMDKVVEAI